MEGMLLWQFGLCPAVDGCVEADTHVSLDCSRCRHERLLPVAVNQVTSLAPLPLQTLDKQLCCAVLLLFPHDFCMLNVTVLCHPLQTLDEKLGAMRKAAKRVYDRVYYGDVLPPIGSFQISYAR